MRKCQGRFFMTRLSHVNISTLPLFKISCKLRFDWVNFFIFEQLERSIHNDEPKRSIHFKSRNAYQKTC